MWNSYRRRLFFPLGFFFFLRQGIAIASAGLEFTICLPQLPTHWDYRYAPLYLAGSGVFLSVGLWWLEVGDFCLRREGAGDGRRENEWDWERKKWF
jgi:hypothetical protein